MDARRDDMKMARSRNRPTVQRKEEKKMKKKILGKKEKRICAFRSCINRIEPDRIGPGRTNHSNLTPKSTSISKLIDFNRFFPIRTFAFTRSFSDPCSCVRACATREGICVRLCMCATKAHSRQISCVLASCILCCIKCFTTCVVVNVGQKSQRKYCSML